MELIEVNIPQVVSFSREVVNLTDVFFGRHFCSANEYQLGTLSEPWTGGKENWCGGSLYFDSKTAVEIKRDIPQDVELSCTHCALSLSFIKQKNWDAVLHKWRKIAVASAMEAMVARKEFSTLRRTMGQQVSVLNQSLKDRLEKASAGEEEEFAIGENEVLDCSIVPVWRKDGIAVTKVNGLGTKDGLRSLFLSTFLLEEQRYASIKESIERDLASARRVLLFGIEEE